MIIPFVAVRGILALVVSGQQVGAVVRSAGYELKATSPGRRCPAEPETDRMRALIPVVQDDFPPI